MKRNSMQQAMWNEEDIEFLRTFDFESTKYCPESPEFDARNINELQDNLEISTMCTAFKNGHCRMGQRCQFGHSLKELIPLRYDNWKQDPCNLLICNDISCPFEHGELRRKLLSDFYLLYGGVLDAPRLCFYPSTPITEETFKKYYHELVDRLERVLPKRLLPSEVIIPVHTFACGRERPL